MGPAVLWEPPAPVAGADITRYDVSWRTDVDPMWTDYSSVVGGPDARTWAPMVAAVPGRRYEFRVRAVAAADPGAWSVPAIVVAPELPTPSAPLNLRLASDGGDLVATWDEPADIASVPVTGYTLRFQGTGIDDKWRTEDVPAGTLRSRIPASYGLVRGGTYRVQVRALGAGGPGPWSAQAEATIPELVLPGLPVWLEPMEVAGGGIALSWEEPRNAAEATVSGYEVAVWSLTAVEHPSSVDVLRRSDQLGHNYQPGVIPPGCEYTARVRAVGENGRGDYACISSCVCKPLRLNNLREPISRCPTIRPTLATSRHGNIREHCRQSSLLTCTILAAVALRLPPAAVASRSCRRLAVAVSKLGLRCRWVVFARPGS